MIKMKMMMIQIFIHKIIKFKGFFFDKLKQIKEEYENKNNKKNKNENDNKKNKD